MSLGKIVILNSQSGRVQIIITLLVKEFTIKGLLVFFKNNYIIKYYSALTKSSSHSSDLWTLAKKIAQTMQKHFLMHY